MTDDEFALRASRFPRPGNGLVPVTNIPLGTITLARDALEAELIFDTLSSLSDPSISPVIVADGGLIPGFTDRLRAVPKVEVVAETRGGMDDQVRRMLSALRATGAPFVFYMESNKKSFVLDELSSFLNQSRRLLSDCPGVGVILPGRDSESFETFPTSQRHYETMTNKMIADETGINLDYCFGPRIISADLLEPVITASTSLGWGWMTLPVIAASWYGSKVTEVRMSLKCPPDERTEDADVARFRATQHEQHMRALDYARTRAD